MNLNLEKTKWQNGWFLNNEWHNNGIASGNDIDVAIKIQNDFFSPNE